MLAGLAIFLLNKRHTHKPAVAFEMDEGKLFIYSFGPFILLQEDKEDDLVSNNLAPDTAKQT